MSHFCLKLGISAARRVSGSHEYLMRSSAVHVPARIRFFHSTPLYFKRRGGSHALEPTPRPFSKKQIKRKKELQIKRNEKFDPKTAKLKEIHMMKKLASPETDKQVENTIDEMFTAVREAMLPDGVQSKVSEKAKTSSFSAEKVLYRLRSAIRNKSSSGTNLFESENALTADTQREDVSLLVSNPSSSFVPSQNTDYYSLNPITLNRALITFIQRNQRKDFDELKYLMGKAGVGLNVASYTALMAAATKNYQFAEAETYFDEMIAKNVEPNIYAW